MKFVKRISLFFIYPMAMFAVGFVSHMTIQDFFYPGQKLSPMRTTIRAEEIVIGNHDADEKYVNEADGVKEQDAEQEIVQETAMNREPVLTANTSYIVVSYNAVSGVSSEQEENAPDGYIGYNRQELEEALLEYEKSPSLTDLEKGFEGAELMSFSSSRVVVRKSYRKKEEGYFLINEDHNVVVYDKTLENVYMSTGIHMEDLPESLQEEIHYMKYVETEEELYNFLESYSS